MGTLRRRPARRSLDPPPQELSHLSSKKEGLSLTGAIPPDPPHDTPRIRRDASGITSPPRAPTGAREPRHRQETCRRVPIIFARLIDDANASGLRGFRVRRYRINLPDLQVIVAHARYADGKSRPLIYHGVMLSSRIRLTFILRRPMPCASYQWIRLSNISARKPHPSRSFHFAPTPSAKLRL